MAIGRLSMKVGKAGKAGPHAAYIAREGQYANRLEHGEKLAATEAGNMPAWAQSNPLEFWQAADANERKNGTTYREMEIALPRELDTAQQVELVREWVKQEIGDRHAYQWAIHVPKAADGGEQPHVHLMFSERQRDGIERDPDQYFKRYNSKHPERGGARKGYGQNAGQTLTRTERAAELKELRGRWESMCNAHLERSGHETRIDMRSHAERGTGLEPEAKQLPSQWRGAGRDNVIEFRAARQELAESRKALAATVPDARGELIDLQQARQGRDLMRRAEQEPEAVQAEYASAWKKIRQGISSQVNRIQSRIEDMLNSAEKIRDGHKRQAPEPPPKWQFWKQEAYQQQAEQWREKGNRLIGRCQTLEHRHHRLTEYNREATPGTVGSFYRKGADVLADQRLERQQPGLAAANRRAGEVVRERQQAERQQKQQAREREQTVAEFKSLATKRKMKAHGYSDRGGKWRDTPEPLKNMVEKYNSQPKQAQAQFLEWMRQEPKVREKVADLMQEARSADRGMSL